MKFTRRSFGFLPVLGAAAPAVAPVAQRMVPPVSRWLNRTHRALPFGQYMRQVHRYLRAQSGAVSSAQLSAINGLSPARTMSALQMLRKQGLVQRVRIGPPGKSLWVAR